MTDLVHLERQLARLRDQHAILGARRPTPAELAGQDDADKAMARRIHQARPGVPPQHVLAVLHALRAVQEMESELTADEARTLADDLGLRLYRAQDALAFVEECCVIADRDGRTVTTADVREWLKGAQCGRRMAASLPGLVPAAGQDGLSRVQDGREGPEAGTEPSEAGSGPQTGAEGFHARLAAAIHDCPARYPDDIATALLPVIEREIAQLRRERDMALNAASQARGGHGPTVTEAAADDRRWGYEKEQP